MSLMHLGSDTHGVLRTSEKKPSRICPAEWFIEPPHPNPVLEIIQLEIIQVGEAHNRKTDGMVWVRGAAPLPQEPMSSPRDSSGTNGNAGTLLCSTKQSMFLLSILSDMNHPFFFQAKSTHIGLFYLFLQN